MAGDSLRRSTRGAAAKRTYVESDDEGKTAQPAKATASSKAKATPKSRKPSSKKVKKSADVIEDGACVVSRAKVAAAHA